MAKFRYLKSALVSGELSPTAHGRLDLPQYPFGCKTLLNSIPLISGGAYRRPGTIFDSNLGAVGTVYGAALFPFIYSQSEVYCIEIGKTVGSTGFIKFYRPTTNSAGVVGGTASGAHLYDRATQGGALGAYDEWHDIQYAQTADVLYLVHPNRKPIKFVRTQIDNFTVNNFDYNTATTARRDAWPYLAQNTTAITLTPSGTSGAITLTASASYFQSTHVGALFKIFDGSSTYGVAEVTGFTSATVVNATVVVDFGSTSARSTWWESAWNDFRGWPRTVAFFQDRIVYGGTRFQPDSLWFSRTSNFDRMSDSDTVDPLTEPTGSDPFTLQILSQQLNQIQWLSPEKTLTVGTIGDEWLIDRETSSSGFGGDNAQVTVQTHYGSAYNRALRIGNELLFCTRDEEELRALVFNFQEDSFVAERIQSLYDEYPKTDMALLKVGNRKIRRFTWDESRSTMWCLDTAGNLFGVTRDRRLQFSAWHRHQLGGYDVTVLGSALGSGSTLTSDPVYTNPSGSVVSIISLPNPLIGHDDLWMVVYRKINGTFRFYLERMIGKNVPFSTAYNEGVTSDIGLYLTDSSIFDNHALSDGDTISGLTHLEGQSVSGYARNANGWFDLTASAVTGAQSVISSPKPGAWDSTTSIVTLGLNYSSVIEPLRIEAGSQIGVSQAEIKRIHELTIRFYRTMSCKVGRDASNLETILFREASTAMGKSAEFFTGDKKVFFDDDYNRDGLVYILQDRPLPFCVLAIVAEGFTYD